ncbi:GNAT family N-acetyltransferase [Timonella sp. A28]|uniref:GNAT family N-acetyltransferase n=1 Tax=Timonella sp. A28 TaxID=3442640 RepID=UPI003EB6DE0B
MEPPDTLKPLSQRIDEQELPQLPTDLGLVWRPLRPSDAAQLFELIVTIEEADDKPYRTSLEETQELFDGEWKHFDTDSLVAIDAHGKFLAFGVLQILPGDETLTRVFLDGGVHPEAREVGIGHALVTWLTARGKNMLRESGSSLPGRIATYLEDNARQHWHLFEEAGYKARRFYKSLKRDLSHDVHNVTLAEHLTLIPFNFALDNAVRLAHNDAFRDHWGSQPQTMESWVQGRSMLMPEWSFVVLDHVVSLNAEEPVVAGYVLTSKYEQDWENSGHTSGYIETLGVRRDYRGQKIALALITAVMRKLQEDNIEYAELDVDSENPSGAFGMYTNLGFEESTSSRMFSLEF